jgi:hypothetical protein
MQNGREITKNQRSELAKKGAGALCQAFTMVTKNYEEEILQRFSALWSFGY